MGSEPQFTDKSGLFTAITNTDNTFSPSPSDTGSKNESNPPISNDDNGYNDDIERYQAKNSNELFSSSEANIARCESNAGASINISGYLTNAHKIEESMGESLAYDVLPHMGGNRPFPGPFPDIQNYTDAFDGPDDPVHPHNWYVTKKICQCAMIGYVCLLVAFGSSCFSAAIIPMTKILQIAPIVATLGISFFVFGFATGPIIWAPLSEIYGRKYALFISTFLFTVFNFAVACSDRLKAVLICRFLACCLGAAQMVAVPASFADMFGN